jgi:hypothetical protein
MSKSPFRPFKSLPARPPSIAIDRLGKMIEPGHLVMFNSPEDLIFEVADVRPVLNPGIPGGQQAIQILLRAEFPVMFLAAQPNRGMVIIGETQAKIAARAANNGVGAVAPEVAPEAPSGIVLTDAPEPVSESTPDPLPAPAPEDGRCGACGHWGVLGETCEKCGDSTYQQVF